MNTPKVFIIVTYNPFKGIKTEHQRFGTEEFIMLQAEYTSSKNPEYYVSVTTNEDPNFHYFLEPKQIEEDKRQVKEGKMEVIDFLIKWAIANEGVDVQPTEIPHRVSDEGVPCSAA
jgi:hypothetical protein